MRTELSNDVVKIRRYRDDDILLLFEAARESVNDMFPWMPWCHQNYSLEESGTFVQSREEAWSQKTDFDFTIRDPETDRFLGGVSLNQFNRDHNFANLGYWVRSSSTGRGIATAAALLLARVGFEDLRLHRIEIVVAVGNLASERVAEKMNANREGVLRNRLLLHDRPRDAVMYGLVAADVNIRQRHAPDPS
jgi:ribosomal-protein-serine acetyltransferase